MDLIVKYISVGKKDMRVNLIMVFEEESLSFPPFSCSLLSLLNAGFIGDLVKEIETKVYCNGDDVEGKKYWYVAFGLSLMPYTSNEH